MLIPKPVVLIALLAAFVLGHLISWYELARSFRVTFARSRSSGVEKNRVEERLA